ncbi:unnamed protein product [Lampetra planeri]
MLAADGRETERAQRVTGIVAARGSLWCSGRGGVNALTRRLGLYPAAPRPPPATKRQRQADERETTRPEMRRPETPQEGPPEKEKKTGPVVGNLVARLGPTRTTRDPGGGRRYSVRKLRSGGRREAERWRKGTKMPAV